MRIPIDTESDIPLYRQIDKYLRSGIVSGAIAAGTRLPPTRELAESLGVSRITVTSAYAEIESDGLVESRGGSGTFVLPRMDELYAAGAADPLSLPLWQTELGTCVTTVRGMPPVRMNHPRPISFTGVGDPRLFPVGEFSRAMQRVIRRDGVASFNYGPFSRGYRPLRETVSYILASQGIRAAPEHILITAGSQQAISLVSRLLLKRGDAVLVESPTYNFALELFESLGLRVVGIPLDDDGMCVDLVEDALRQHHPKLIYTIPNFQNPTGLTLTVSRRRQLLALANTYNVPILEDDFAGDLRFEGREPGAIKSFDHTGSVIYTGTFSKMLMPGIRVGFLVAEGPVLERLSETKRSEDLTTSTLMQRSLNEYVTIGRYQSHLKKTGRIYRRRRDAMTEAVRRYLPDDFHQTIPRGGLFLWLDLPPGESSTRLLEYARAEGVEYAPGSLFFPDPDSGARYLRLNFASQVPEDIEDGIMRLGKALRKMRNDG